MDETKAKWRKAMMKMRPILGYCEDPDQIVHKNFVSQASVISEVQREQNQNEKELLSWRHLHEAYAKLKSSKNTSEILSLFTLVTMVEIQLNSPTAVPDWLWVMFALSTTVLVSVHVLALLIATYLLPAIEPLAKMKQLGSAPHEKMKPFIELAWILSNTVGIFLFIMQLVILLWVKFYDYSFSAAITATSLAIPAFFVLIGFSLFFYKISATAKLSSSLTEVSRLEQMYNDV